MCRFNIEFIISKTRLLLLVVTIHINRISSGSWNLVCEYLLLNNCEINQPRLQMENWQNYTDFRMMNSILIETNQNWINSEFHSHFVLLIFNFLISPKLTSPKWRHSFAQRNFNQSLRTENSNFIQKYFSFHKMSVHQARLSSAIAIVEF